jgi:recombination protein RecA
VGSRVRAKIVKNKVAAPFKTVEFDIYYGVGISKFSDFLNAGIKQNLIKKTGNTFTFGDIKLGVGIEAAKNFLKENPETIKKLKKEIQEKLKE